MSTEPTTPTSETPDRGNRRLLLLAAAGVVAIALSVLAFGNVGDNLVYFWSPTEVHEAGPDARGASFRLAGLVAEDSVSRSEDGLTLEFTVTDGTSEIDVRTSAVPPAMFREGIGVVLEGTLRENGEFETSRLLVKHDNEYQAPDVDDQRSMEELIESMQFDT